MGAYAKSSKNILLRRLPRAEWAAIAPFVHRSILETGAVLCAAGASIAHAVFPSSGIVALIAPTPDGSTVHSGFVGCDGMFGLPLSIGASRSFVEARVEGSGEAITIESRRFRQVLASCPVLDLRVRQSGQRLMDQVTRIAACNGHHTIEARTARWILLASDRMASDIVALKQSSLAEMLGVLRPSVSQAASALRARGLVDYHRGEMRIVDRIGLATAACGCYAVMASAYANSMGGKRSLAAKLRVEPRKLFL